MVMSDAEITLSSEKWVFLLTVSWCCIYVVANTAFQIRLRQLVDNNPLTYPETLVTKASTFANYVTSTINSVIAIASTIAFLPVMLSTSFTSTNRGVNGPNVAGTAIIYLSFIAYVIYDTIYESVLCETPLADLPIIVHHLLYMVITWLLYVDQSFPILSFVLFCQELSTPFLNAMQAMKVFSLDTSRAFTVNAWCLTVTFCLFRVVLPGVALGHVFLRPPTWDWVRIFIITCVTAGYCMQIFWFSKILKGLLKHLRAEPKTEETGPLLNADIAAGGSQ